MAEVVVTGIGLVTPLGCNPGDILCAIEQNRTAVRPSPFASFAACPFYAPIMDFDAERYFPENKSLRLMNRDAQMAAVAARLATQDAGLFPDALYPAEEIALYGATGLAGLPADEIARLVEGAAAADGSLDLERFGHAALKRIRPVLSFKILANMPMCFVSIFENIRGPNAVYTPWEGQGAQAIVSGIQAIADGDVPCALVGGCDVKTHAFSLAALDQFGVWDSWRRHGDGSVPGEGAAFLVLEDRNRAERRNARIYAAVRSHAIRSVQPNNAKADVFHDVLKAVDVAGKPCFVAAGDGDVEITNAERSVFERHGWDDCAAVYPKKYLGNLFAAAAGVQVALAAVMVSQHATTVVADCFGFGGQQAAFRLEAA